MDTLQLVFLARDYGGQKTHKKYVVMLQLATIMDSRKLALF